MNLPYQVVNQCLRELQDLEIPQVRKLQIEIELLQIKRLLLLPRAGNSVTANNAIYFETFKADFAAIGKGSEKWSADKLFALVKDLHAALRLSDIVPHRPRQQ